MGLSEFEIGKIAEIVAGRVGSDLDAKGLRQVIDKVVDSLQTQQGNPGITGVTCETPRSQSTTYRPTQPQPPDERMLADQAGLYKQIEKTNGNRIIIAAFGQNRPGVVAALTAVLAENKCNIEDISQKIMQEFFSMIMIVDISACTVDFQTLADRIKSTEAQLGMKVYSMHEDIFRYMHRI